MLYIAEGTGNPLQYSCLEKLRDRGAWWSAVYGVAQSRTWLKRLSSMLYIDTNGVIYISSVQSRPTLCEPMDHSTSGLPVHYQLPEFTQTCLHWVGDAIQPFHPLSSPSPLAFSLSQHQGFSKEPVLLIRWPKHWSFSFSIVLLMNIQGWFPLGLTVLISLQSKGLSRVFSNTTVQKHQLFIAQLSL